MPGPFRLVLYEPDIPQNAGAILRLGACLETRVDFVEPCGFRYDDKLLRRAGLDYLERAEMTRHRSWAHYRADWLAEAPEERMLLLTRHGDLAYTGFRFRPGDRLVLGRESAGVPEAVHAEADARLVVPLRPGLRSLNVAQVAAMALGEALRQLDAFPAPSDSRPSSEEPHPSP